MHTKLTETLIFNWAKLIGFNSSELPTQKSSYEDITISDQKNTIVCDAKSFRLGRSQKSPNVKDTIKLADYEKWLVKHGEKGIGGLITFPSLHDWKKGSDVYQYVSNPAKKVLLLFYEHISFFLISFLTILTMSSSVAESLRPSFVIVERIDLTTFDATLFFVKIKFFKSLFNLDNID